MVRARPVARAALAWAAASVCILHASVAAAGGPCDRGRPGLGTPIRVPVFGPADLGVAQEACARTSLTLESRLALLIAEDDFYGSVLMGAALRASLRLPFAGAWLSAWLPGLEYRFIANATVESDGAALGAGALGFHAPIARTERAQLVAYGRVLVPTETVFARARRYGFEPGLSGVWSRGAFEVVGAMSFASLVTALPGRATLEWAPSLSTDLIFRPARGFGLALGAGLRPLSSFDPHAQLRFYPYRALAISLGAALPVGGRDRTNLAGAVSIGWDD
jgi:hypothetical protein